ncbi:MAG: YihA family ribosome biogenesis GTP-binding protein [Deltaproteobacteria bacterium]|nr:YihA family ribosome biogenesis GTP-binding protein [Candidatus Zymogenaceae bacterium]
MKIVKAEFIKSASSVSDYPRSLLPQVAFAGRSNVGKSSLINCLVERKDLAKTSSVPGKTRAINFFSVNDSIVFVDLPGYGYARVSKEIRQTWRPMVEGFFTSSPTIRIAVIIIDIRRGPEVEELNLASWLSVHSIPVLFVATKADKEKKGLVKARVKDIAQVLEVSESDIVLFSAKTRVGRDLLWSRIRETCNG